MFAKKTAGAAAATAIVLAALAGAGLFLLNDAHAQGAVKAKHGEWATRCETPPGASHEQCAVVLSVFSADRPNINLVLIVINTADRKARLLRIIAPLGVLLPSGVGLKIDDEDLGHVNFVRCIPNGCLAEAEIKDKLIDKMKTGRNLTLAISENPEETVSISAALAGFKDAYEQLP